MTGSQLVARIRELLDDDALSQSLIIAAGNAFQNELFAEVKTRIMQESDDLTVAVDSYSTELPSDLQKILFLSMESPQVASMMRFKKEYPVFMDLFPNYKSQASGTLSYWTIYGSEIRFSNKASVEHKFSIDYYRRPINVVALGDSFELPDQYDNLLVKGTLSEMMKTNEDYAEASEEIRGIEGLRLLFKTNEGVGMDAVGPVIMKSGMRNSRRA